MRKPASKVRVTIILMIMWLRMNRLAVQSHFKMVVVVMMVATVVRKDVGSDGNVSIGGEDSSNSIGDGSSGGDGSSDDSYDGEKGWFNIYSNGFLCVGVLA